jgi:hypothetical protein
VVRQVGKYSIHLFIKCYSWVDFITINPFFEILWDNPEYKAIVKRVQDEKAAIRAQIREAEERGELDL